MRRRLSEDVTRELRAQHDQFLRELDRLRYTPNARDTYDKNIERFIRWLEGRWEPEGPRGPVR
jgi:hypothetical protein